MIAVWSSTLLGVPPRNLPEFYGDTIVSSRFAEEILYLGRADRGVTPLEDFAQGKDWVSSVILKII